jgi:hypothetical protein
MATKPYIIGEYNALEYKVLNYSDKFPNGEEVYSAGNSPFDSQGYVDADKGVGLERMKQFCEQTAKEISVENGIEYKGIQLIEAC